MKLRKNHHFAVLPSYPVPAARLHYFEPKEPENYVGMPHQDSTFPIPCDWITANASRFYFTNKQIIEAAKPEFVDPRQELSCRLWAVYFLICNGEIVYVGQSSNLERRLEQHVESGKVFDAITWFEAPKWFLSDIEAYYIWRCNPVLNNTWPTFNGEFNAEAKKLDEKYGEKRNDAVYITTISPAGMRSPA